MTKYTVASQRRVRREEKQISPVWRGIGCIMMIVVPILSYGISMFLVNYGAQQGWPIPPEWFGPPTIPPLLEKLRGLQPILQPVPVPGYLQPVLKPVSRSKTQFSMTLAHIAQPITLERLPDLLTIHERRSRRKHSP